RMVRRLPEQPRHRLMAPYLVMHPIAAQIQQTRQREALGQTLDPRKRRSRDRRTRQPWPTPQLAQFGGADIEARRNSRSGDAQPYGQGTRERRQCGDNLTGSAGTHQRPSDLSPFRSLQQVVGQRAARGVPLDLADGDPPTARRGYPVAPSMDASLSASARLNGKSRLPS